MKKVLLGLALCAFTFVACDETNNGDENGDNGNGGNGGNGGGNTTAIVDNTISGTLKRVIDNYDGRYFDGDVTDEIDEIRGFVYNEDTDEDVPAGSSPVSNGRFSIKLDASKLGGLEDITHEMPEALTISDRNAKWGSLELEGFKGGYCEGWVRIYPANLSEEMDFNLMYIDRDVTISGSYVMNNRDDEDPGHRNHDRGYIEPVEFEKRNTKSDDEFRVSVNMNLKKGWNLIVFNMSGENNGTVTTNNTFTNIVWGVRFDEPVTNNDPDIQYPDERKWNDDRREDSYGKSNRTKTFKSIWR